MSLTKNILGFLMSDVLSLIPVQTPWSDTLYNITLHFMQLIGTAITQ